MSFLRIAAAAILALSLHTGAAAQSADSRIIQAMNSADWFALDSIHSHTPKDSISDFLEVYSRCLIGNRLNRPDVSIPAFQELLNSHSGSLDLSNLMASASMFGMDLSRVGHNQAAADMMNSIINAVSQYLDSATVASTRRFAATYSELARYTPYQLERPDSVTPARIPFRIMPAGPAEKETVLMHLTESSINGIEADITFDTGAGINVISEEMAARLNLIPLDATIEVRGIGVSQGRCAIAREVRLGNLTVRDVPFYISNFSTGNAEADSYVEHFSIILGSELMLQLRDLTIDFAQSEITVPAQAPGRSGQPANMCFSGSMNLLTKGSVLGTPLLINIDTGDAGFGALSQEFFQQHHDYVTTHAEADTMRVAGHGGVIISSAYEVPDMPVSIGGTTVRPPAMTVWTSTGGYICNLGLKTLMMFRAVRFNLVDFTLTTTP